MIEIQINCYLDLIGVPLTLNLLAALDFSHVTSAEQCQNVQSE
jgi:hypothetical protein